MSSASGASAAVLVFLSGGLLLMAQQPAPGITVRIQDLSEGAAHRVVLLGARDNCARELERNDEPQSLTLAGPCWEQCPDPASLRARVAVFARNHAVAYLSQQQICNRTPGEPLMISMKPRVKVKVAIFAAREQIVRARDALLNADWVFNESRAGITLDAGIRQVPRASLPAVDPDGSREKNCGIAAASPLLQADVVNVFFGIGQSLACESGAIVFVERTGELKILAHELAHALGLLHGNDGERLYSEGHSNEQTSFDCANTMWTGSHIIEEGFSLGQAFWIGTSDQPFSKKARDDQLSCRTRPELCMPFAIPRRDPPGGNRCNPCTFNQALGIDEQQTRARRDFRRLLREGPRLCTNIDRQDALIERFRLLVPHGRSAGILPGSSTAPDFAKRWFRSGEVAVLVEAISGATDPKLRQAGIARLEEISTQGWPDGNDYLVTCIRRLKAGDPAPQPCFTTR